MDNYLFGDAFYIESLWNDETGMDNHDPTNGNSVTNATVPAEMNNNKVKSNIFVTSNIPKQISMNNKLSGLQSEGSDILDESSFGILDSDTQNLSDNNENSKTEDNSKPIKRKRTGNRIRWTKEEDEALRALVMKYNKRNWKQIARELGTNRIDTECRQHFCRVLDRTSAKGRWTFAETSRLAKALNEHDDWKDISVIVRTRDKNQCFLKWKQLQKVPEGAREWTLDEHRAMIELYKTYTDNWGMIANEIGTDITADDVLQHYRQFVVYDCFK